MLCKIHVPSAQSRFFEDHRAPAEEMKGWPSSMESNIDEVWRCVNMGYTFKALR